MSTGTITSPITPTRTESNDELEISPPDGQSHYARKTELGELGGIVTALCGHRWIPNTRNHEEAGKKTVCPKCKKLMDLLHQMHS